MPKRKAEDEGRSQAGANKKQNQENKKLVLKDTIELISELNSLAQDTLECTDQKVKQSSVYQLIQDATELDASESGLSRDAIILLANIAATSPNLRILNFSSNKFGEFGVNVSKVLAKSLTLCNINLSNNDLLQDSLKVTEELLKLPTLRILSMRGNNIEVVDLDFDDEGQASPEYSADNLLEERIQDIINAHNQEVSSKEEMVRGVETHIPNHDIMGIIGDYYSNDNHISSDYIKMIEGYDSTEY